ncbi:helix-turn-helix transcriptional regulator [Piscinibacter sp.]|jgi:DNA-binding CsgD family transcriptional regulator|uniref:helix-turn-helix transcriptional regulator n=1 Tax=Piscinibacter sp. TaxID=1903157 RepID=UPI002F4088B3
MTQWIEWGEAARGPAPPRWGDAAAAIGDASLLMRVLDEIDYGLLLVNGSGMLRYGNQLGMSALHGAASLRLVQGCVQAGHATDQAAFRAALADAQRGRRKLFSLGRDGGAVSVAAVPMLAGADEPDDALALLVFGKRRRAETLTLDFYARSHGLTATEMTVLKDLGAGMKPKEVARAHGVAISTVRSHITSIRTKTQTGSIRELLGRVATLPPITPAMKALAGGVECSAVH